GYESLCGYVEGVVIGEQHGTRRTALRGIQLDSVIVVVTALDVLEDEMAPVLRDERPVRVEEKIEIARARRKARASRSVGGSTVDPREGDPVELLVCLVE